MNRKQGFTLIELSIVLVIIGLIVGGVLVGQDLIESSKNRALLSQLEKYSTATQTFRLKFNALPADIPNPSTFGFSDYTVDADIGNNDKQIADSHGNIPPTASWGENYIFFIHLGQAKLIDGTYAYQANTYNWCDGNGLNRQFAAMKAGKGGIMPYSYQSAIHYFLGLNTCGTALNSVASMSTAGVLSPQSAFYIDTKLDDGAPGSGKVKAVTHTNGTLDTTDGNCVKDTASNYNLAKSSLECRLSVKAP